ncbi:DNA repair protein complementing XP-A cells homolog [Ceratina calcarata]|uniref:DNA repair protein complementing XP-A cells homolog n=1 Tax=Ceratina calcarata TaxID=156304 RepID=A0AAJ7JAR8_9HYME|nr:DNA repair protein complementing XP-A cells homolog [Ceratina calcarata]XP_026673403.1 DNA repair protein complementing XP-A cells homolog [Ceratina calcarata]
MSTNIEINDPPNNNDPIKDSQHFKERAERNREKALMLKKSKIVSHPYKKGETGNSVKGKTLKVQTQRIIDTKGGFLIEENDELEEQMLNVVEELGPIIINFPHCDECKQEFKDSYLLQKFDLSVCDNCRDSNGKHSLMTRTKAKGNYLLNDCDLDQREPPLKYIVRKNPHNPNWGEMKLYLELQVEQRALEVWGSEENLLNQQRIRDSKKEEAKMKKFGKSMKILRMAMRSSLYDKTSRASHTHEYTGEIYNPDNDTYTHTCITCGYEETYEKM